MTYLKHKKVGKAIPLYQKMYQDNPDRWAKTKFSADEIRAFATWIKAGNPDIALAWTIYYAHKMPKLILELADKGQIDLATKVFVKDPNEVESSLASQLVAQVRYETQQAPNLALIFGSLGHNHHEGIVLEKLERFKEAADAYKQAGDLSRAMHCCQRAGLRDEAKKLETMDSNAQKMLAEKKARVEQVASRQADPLGSPSGFSLQDVTHMSGFKPTPEPGEFAKEENTKLVPEENTDAKIAAIVQNLDQSAGHGAEDQTEQDESLSPLRYEIEPNSQMNAPSDKPEPSVKKPIDLFSPATNDSSGQEQSQSSIFKPKITMSLVPPDANEESEHPAEPEHPQEPNMTLEEPAPIDQASPFSLVQDPAENPEPAREFNLDQPDVAQADQSSEFVINQSDNAQTSEFSLAQAGPAQIDQTSEFNLDQPDTAQIDQTSEFGLAQPDTAKMETPDEFNVDQPDTAQIEQAGEFTLGGSKEPQQREQDHTGGILEQLSSFDLSQHNDSNPQLAPTQEGSIFDSDQAFQAAPKEESKIESVFPPKFAEPIESKLNNSSSSGTDPEQDVLNQDPLSDIFSSFGGDTASNLSAKSNISEKEMQSFKQNCLFKKVSANFVDKIWHQGFTERLKKNDSIMTLQDHPLGVYIILSGTVVCESEGSTTSQGQLSAGESFGETSVLASKVADATYTATEDSLIFKINATKLKSLMQEDYSMAIQLFTNFTDRLLSSSQRADFTKKNQDNS